MRPTKRRYEFIDANPVAIGAASALDVFGVMFGVEDRALVRPQWHPRPTVGDALAHDVAVVVGDARRAIAKVTGG